MNSNNKLKQVYITSTVIANLTPQELSELAYRAMCQLDESNLKSLRADLNELIKKSEEEKARQFLAKNLNLF